MNNCEKALAAVADAIARQAEHESKPEGLLLLAQAAASITEADKMVSGNLVKPLMEKSDDSRFSKGKK